MEDKSLFSSNQSVTISEGLQNFIDSMVEEIVLEGKPFDSQKKYLKKFSEKEGLNYDKLEEDINTFLEILESLETAFNKPQVKLAEEKGRECYISEGAIKKLVTHSSQPRQPGGNVKTQGYQETKQNKGSFKVIWLNVILFLSCIFFLISIYAFILLAGFEAAGCAMVVYGLYLQRRTEYRNPKAIRWLFIGSFVIFLIGLTDGGFYIGIIYFIISIITHFLYRK